MDSDSAEQRELEQLRVEIARLRQERASLEQLLDSAERDRQLVAYEIHDSFVQGVISALMYLDAYGAAAAENKQRPADLDAARSLLRKSINEARRLIGGLRPPTVGEQGIVGALETLVQEMKARGFEVELHLSLPTVRLTENLESTILRIVQEGLTNFERHSQVRKAVVRIEQLAGTIRLEIRDAGVGFDLADEKSGHFGLEGIKQRAALTGGSARVESSPGKGTIILVELPTGAVGSTEPDRR